jgi:hypothetical protein
MKKMSIASGVTLAIAASVSTTAYGLTLVTSGTNYAAEAAMVASLNADPFTVPGTSTIDVGVSGLGGADIAAGEYTLTLSLSDGATFQSNPTIGVFGPNIDSVTANGLASGAAVYTVDVGCGGAASCTDAVSFSNFTFQDVNGELGGGNPITMSVSLVRNGSVVPPFTANDSNPTGALSSEYAVQRFAGATNGGFAQGAATIDVTQGRLAFLSAAPGDILDDSGNIGVWDVAGGVLLDPATGLDITASPTCPGGTLESCFMVDVSVYPVGSSEGVQSVTLNAGAIPLPVNADGVFVADGESGTDVFVDNLDVGIALYDPASADAVRQNARAWNIEMVSWYAGEQVNTFSGIITNWDLNGTAMTVEFASASPSYEQTFWIRNPQGPDASVLVNVWSYQVGDDGESVQIGTEGNVGTVNTGSSRGFSTADIQTAIGATLPSIFWAEFLIESEDAVGNALLGTYQNGGASAIYTQNPMTK